MEGLIHGRAYFWNFMVTTVGALISKINCRLVHCGQREERLSEYKLFTIISVISQMKQSWTLLFVTNLLLIYIGNLTFCGFNHLEVRKHTFI